MEPWLIDGVIFNHPFNCIISGPTMCGKTFILREVLKYKDALIKPSPNRIFYCYKEWQSVYDKFKQSIQEIKFISGNIGYEELNENINNIVIFDDLMKECIESENVMNIFTVGSHHKNTSTFFITQNIFSQGKFARDISLNANYMLVFRNPRDQQQIQILSRQMYPQNSKFLIESFNDATSKPHGYLFLDLRQTTEERNRLQSGILPSQKRIIYQKKN